MKTGETVMPGCLGIMLAVAGFVGIVKFLAYWRIAFGG